MAAAALAVAAALAALPAGRARTAGRALAARGALPARGAAGLDARGGHVVGTRRVVGTGVVGGADVAPEGGCDLVAVGGGEALGQLGRAAREVRLARAAEVFGGEAVRVAAAALAVAAALGAPRATFGSCSCSTTIGHRAYSRLYREPTFFLNAPLRKKCTLPTARALLCGVLFFVCAKNRLKKLSTTKYIVP